MVYTRRKKRPVWDFRFCGGSKVNVYKLCARKAYSSGLGREERKKLNGCGVDSVVDSGEDEMRCAALRLERGTSTDGVGFLFIHRDYLPLWFFSIQTRKRERKTKRGRFRIAKKTLPVQNTQ